MMIGEISGIGSGISMPVAGGNDQVSRDIQSQIDRATQQLKKIAEDENMSPEEKSKKRQEIQKEISNLENELRQHQVEMRREAASSKKSENNKKYEGEGSEKGMSAATMESVISADNSIKQVDRINGLKTSMKGQVGVLETEIKLDRSKGIDTGKKEEKLHTLEDRINHISSYQFGEIAKADEEIKNNDEKEDDQIDKGLNDPSKILGQRKGWRSWKK